MPEEPTPSESSWFSDAGLLVDELRRGGIRFHRAPDLAGYDVLEEIGRGGQGIVYSAMQKATRRRVAIKCLSETTGAAGRSRFEREIETVAALDHPSIVRVYDSGELSDGRLYVIMEYVEGLSFREFARGCRPSTGVTAEYLKHVLNVFADICRAVHYAHQRGIIHRDLKPSNILVTNRAASASDMNAGAEMIPKILDFGLARALDVPVSTGITRTGAFLGTLAYAAPEQLTGGQADIDIRTDAYALGLMLYEALKGDLPYATDAPMAEVIRNICEARAAAPVRGSVASGIGRSRLSDLNTIALKSITKQKHERYDSAEDLARDVELWISGEPIEARRDRTTYLLRKLIARHRRAFLAASVLSIVLVGFVIALTVQYRRTRVEAEKVRQINYFLQDTLGSVGPSESGEPVTVKQVLDDALNWMNTLEGQPEIEASLRNTIGNSYRAIGEWEAAEDQLHAALAIRRGLFGDDHLQTIETLNSMGWLAMDRGQLEEGERLFRRSLDGRRKALGEDHLDVAMSRQNLARVLSKRGVLASAQREAERCVAIRLRQLGDKHLDVAAGLSQLGLIQRDRGLFDAAHKNLNRSLAIRRQKLPKGHPDVARSLMELARLQILRGEIEEAKRILEEARESLGESGSLNLDAELDELLTELNNEQQKGH